MGGGQPKRWVLGEGLIERLHRAAGIGMAKETVLELADEHLASQRRRNGLPLREHLAFLANDQIRRFDTSPRTDLNAHFLPALILTFLGVVVYLAGGRSVAPGGSPSWPVIPMAGGLLLLIVWSLRLGGFPIRGAVIPVTLTALSTAANAAVMPVAVPEDQLVRAGMATFALSGPVCFYLLARHHREPLPWEQIAVQIAGNRTLRLVWHAMTLGIAMMAAGQLWVSARADLAGTVRIGTALTGVGMAWMAQSFNRTTRFRSEPCPGESLVRE